MPQQVSGGGMCVSRTDPTFVPGFLPAAEPTGLSDGLDLTGEGVGSPSRRIGFEIELLAPRGRTRADLAEEVARRCGGRVRRYFHTDSEPSLVPGMDHFIHLTLGFEVLGPDGVTLCRLADDITIREDLDPRTPPLRGWYRIVGDEPRLMRLVHRLADPSAPLDAVLDPVGEVFGVCAEHIEGIVRINDAAGATIAMAAPLPGERERPCEVITAPIGGDHRARLDQLLEPARDLGFTVPAEAAVHLHVDAAPLRQVFTFANLVRLFSTWREQLWQAVGTNPKCRRLAPPPAAVVELVAGRLPTEWHELCALVAPLGLTKFADVNLTSLMNPRPDKDTVEIRFLPGSVDTDVIIGQTLLVERLLDRCRDPRPLPAPGINHRLSDLLA
jgi:hypothetical protein